MPSKSIITWEIVEHVGMVCYNTTDPRRLGRVDSAIFPSQYVDYFKQRSITFKSGEFYVNGMSFTKFFAQVYHLDYRIDDTADYFERNFMKRPVPAYIPDISVYRNTQGSAKSKNSYQLEFHEPVKYKSRSDYVKLNVAAQSGMIATILINTYLVHHVPTKMFIPRGKNGLYFIDRESRNSYNDRHGVSLAAYLLRYLGNENPTSHDVVRSHPYDYRIDMDTLSYISTLCVTNHYKAVSNGVEEGSVLLQLQYAPPTSWAKYPLNSEEKWRNDEECTVNILIDSEFEEDIRDYLWKYEAQTHEIVARNEDGKRVLLKRFVATCAGLDIGATIIPSRMTKYYKQAIETDNYKRRAHFENVEFTSQGASNKRFTFARSVKWRKLSVNQQVEVAGVCCLDMRKAAIQVL